MHHGDFLAVQHGFGDRTHVKRSIFQGPDKQGLSVRITSEKSLHTPKSLAKILTLRWLKRCSLPVLRKFQTQQFARAIPAFGIVKNFCAFRRDATRPVPAGKGVFQGLAPPIAIKVAFTFPSGAILAINPGFDPGPRCNRPPMVLLGTVESKWRIVQYRRGQPDRARYFLWQKLSRRARQRNLSKADQQRTAFIR